MSTAQQKTDDKGMTAYVPFGSDLPIKLSVKIVQSLISVKTRQGHVAGERDCLKFIAMCQAQKLNPFAGDAFLIGYDSDQGPTFSLITAHQAFLKRAEVSPDYDGMESGVIVFDEASQQVKEIQGDFYEKDQIVIGGWAKVYHKRRKIPTYRRLRVERFDTEKAEWRKDAAGMICKCAEADALRATFPTMLGGLYHEGERNLGTAIEVGTVLADEPQQNPGPQPVIENGPNVQALTSPSPTQPTAPAPQPVADNEPTPQMKLAAWAIDQGYNFDQFVQWGKLTSNIRRDFAGVSFDDLPTAECKRWLRATDSILTKMKSLGDALNA